MRQTTSRYFLPVKPRWLRRTRRAYMQDWQRPVSLDAARNAAAFWNCTVRRSRYAGAGYIVSLDLAGAHVQTHIASLDEAIDAARALYEHHQLAAHHAALAMALHMSPAGD